MRREKRPGFRVAPLLLGAATALFGAAARGAGEGPKAPIHLGLDYVVAPELEKACFDAESFERRVYVEVEYGPFTPPASDGTLVVRAEKVGQEIEVVWRVSPPSPRMKESAYRGKARTCADAMTDAIAALEDALPPPPVSPPPPPPPPPPQPVIAPPPRPLKLRLGASLGVALGASPAPALGLSVDVGLRLPSFSIALEGRAILPASMDVAHATKVPGERLSSRLLAAAIAPCGHWRMIFGCGLLQGGALQASTSGGSALDPATAPFFAVGGRFGGEIQIASSPVFLRAFGDLMGTLVATRIGASKAGDVWAMPPVSGALSGGVWAVF